MQFITHLWNFDVRKIKIFFTLCLLNKWKTCKKNSTWQLCKKKHVRIFTIWIWIISNRAPNSLAGFGSASWNWPIIKKTFYQNNILLFESHGIDISNQKSLPRVREHIRNLDSLWLVLFFILCSHLVFVPPRTRDRQFVAQS